MPAVDLNNWYHSNKYSAQDGCAHCAGIVRHESWCITRNTQVAYAYAILLDPGQVTIADQLALHALGISWARNVCPKKCKE